MSPEEVKARVQDAHRRAMANASMQISRGSNIHHLFRGVRLFGRDAGTDFVETNLDAIVREAVSMAECKLASLEIPAYGFGRAATEGMAQALGDLTGLRVDVTGNILRLGWAQPTACYVWRRRSGGVRIELFRRDPAGRSETRAVLVGVRVTHPSSPIRFGVGRDRHHAR